MSRTTIYRNFATREEPAAAVHEDNVARIERRAAELAAASDVMLAFSMAGGAFADHGEDRPEVGDRLRAMLHRALFTR